MDLESSPKSPDDTEIETPPHGGASLKRRHHAPPALYKECMRNHAAAIGGHAVDGCGEFMPPPSSAAGDLRCAACGCHRSFHRRGSPPAITPPFLDFRRPPPPKRFSLSPPTTAARSFLGEESQPAPVTPTAENPACRKRFRTRFSQEQKEKMHRFAAAMGWRMQKSDDAAVREFCREVGVTKGVLKVWMHNNKNTFVKKEAGNNGGLISFENVGAGGGIQNESVNGTHFSGGRGSSSSS
ncbi:ZF-HD homeobox domain-containing protein [Striga asiatica]|uniref:ZF-HD homeobox domain-containing protein n=1 Tax=Striga asiatica TaxID=4170 RepID=A0A5A7QH21_STRAF|nr:ZF-HD homeobox domain-containing protein [Striga asiatica]